MGRTARKELTMRRWLVPATALLSLTFASSAWAADDCPPGSWFCEEVDVPDADAADADEPEVDDVDEADEPAAEPPPRKKAKPKKAKKAKKPKKTIEVDGEGGDTVVIVKGEEKVVVVEKEKEFPDPPPPPAKKKRRWRERFGVNLHLQGAGYPSAYSEDGAGMGGVGASFRWRPSPYFALDTGVDVLRGTGYYGEDRMELAGSLSGLVYFNPQHRVQVYGIGGVHLAHAEVDQSGDWTWSDGDWVNAEGRDYFGVQAGLGVEFRLSRLIGLHIDGLAVVREKISGGAPEFVDPVTGATTNTSAGGLMRAGINFWW